MLQKREGKNEKDKERGGVESRGEAGEGQRERDGAEEGETEAGPQLSVSGRSGRK